MRLRQAPVTLARLSLRFPPNHSISARFFIFFLLAFSSKKTTCRSSRVAMPPVQGGQHSAAKGPRLVRQRLSSTCQRSPSCMFDGWIYVIGYLRCWYCCQYLRLRDNYLSDWSMIPQRVPNKYTPINYFICSFIPQCLGCLFSHHPRPPPPHTHQWLRHTRQTPLLPMQLHFICHCSPWVVSLNECAQPMVGVWVLLIIPISPEEVQAN